MEKKLFDKYDIMEEKLKDSIKDIKTIKQIGRELISKMKLIDEEINIINPYRINYNELSEENRNKLSVLYNLKNQYNNKLDMIFVVLNESDKMIDNYMINKLEEVGLNNKFIIKI
jgi:hypothetical protein